MKRNYLILIGSLALLLVGYCTAQRRDEIPATINVAFNPVTQQPYTREQTDSIIEHTGQHDPEITAIGVIMMVAGAVGLIMVIVHKEPS